MVSWVPKYHPFLQIKTSPDKVPRQKYVYLQTALAARKLKAEFCVQMQPFSLAQFAVTTVVPPFVT